MIACQETYSLQLINAVYLIVRQPAVLIAGHSVSVIAKKIAKH